MRWQPSCRCWSAATSSSGPPSCATAPRRCSSGANKTHTGRWCTRWPAWPIAAISAVRSTRSARADLTGTATACLRLINALIDHAPGDLVGRIKLRVELTHAGLIETLAELRHSRHLPLLELCQRFEERLLFDNADKEEANVEAKFKADLQLRAIGR